MPLPGSHFFLREHAVQIIIDIDKHLKQTIYITSLLNQFKLIL